MKKRPICQMAAAFVVGLLMEYTRIPKSQLMKLFPDVPWEVLCWLFFGGVMLVAWIVGVISYVKNSKRIDLEKLTFWKIALGKGSLKKSGSLKKRKSILLKIVLLGICLLLGQAVMKEATTSYLPENISEGSSITVTGRIKKYEIKNQQIYYYLKTNAVYHDVMVTVKFQNSASNYDPVNDNSAKGYVLTDDSHNNNSVRQKITNGNSDGLVQIPTIRNQKVEIGMTIQATGTLSMFSTPTNEGQFNQRLYYKSQNIDFSIRNAKLNIIDDKKNSLADGLHRLQQYLSKQIQVLAGEEGGILGAMLFGDKTSMDNADKKLYQRHGIAHVMSISGLHISILGLGLYKFLCKCKCPQWVAAVLGGIFVVLFGVLTGMSVSTLRAVVMYMLNMGARICGRTYDMPTSVSLAAMMVLLERPYALFQSSMQFSFGAIFALILFDKLEREGLRNILSKKMPTFFEGFFVSVHIQLVTLPVQLYHTFYFSIYSSLLNLFVIPTMSIILSLGMVATLWSVIFQSSMSSVAHFLIFPCRILLLIYEFLCQLAEKIPGSVQVFGQPMWWQILLYYLLLVIFCLGLTKFKTSGGVARNVNTNHNTFLDRCASVVLRAVSIRNAGSIRNARSIRYGFLILPVCMVLMLRPGSFSGVEITMLDVGQGESICLQLPNNKVILSDGGSTDVSKVGTYRIKPFLLANGISVVDAVFVSHWDEDHVSGIRELLTEKPREILIKTLVLPETEDKDETLLTLIAEAENAGVTIQYVKMGDTCTFGDVTFTCLWPKERLVTEDRNDYSAVFRMSYNQFQMLLTGDLPAEYEEELLGNAIATDVSSENGLECEVLKVAHHGSKYSTSLELLEKVQPKVALISCGEDNSYGHPHEELIERLEEAGCKVMSTPEYGAVTVKVGKKIEVRSYWPPTK